MRGRTHIPLRTAASSIFALLFLAIAASIIGGCNYVAPAVYIIEGPPSNDPVYRLERDRPTLIMVDDRTNQLPRPSLRQVISETAEELLLKKGTLKRVIGSKAAYVTIAQDKSDSTVSITELGRELGAEIVVYITIDRYEEASSGNELAQAFAMRAKVLDVGRAEPRLWPEAREGLPFGAKLISPPMGDTTSISAAQQQHVKAARQAGKSVAQLFMKHEIKDSAALGR